MVTNITDYQTPGEFAKQYKGKFKKRDGVNRSQITRLIQQEIATPGTTGIDVLIVGGFHFVRYSPGKVITAPKSEAIATGDLIKAIIKKA